MRNTGKPLSFAFLNFSMVITPPYPPPPPSPPEMNPDVSKYFLFANYFGHFHLRHIRCNYVYFGGISLIGTLCDAFSDKDEHFLLLGFNNFIQSMCNICLPVTVKKLIHCTTVSSGALMNERNASVSSKVLYNVVL